LGFLLKHETGLGLSVGNMVVAGVVVVNGVVVDSVAWACRRGGG
jgi:hypothetical protein